MDETITIDAICREYIAKARHELAKTGTPSAVGVKALGDYLDLDKLGQAALSPLEVVTAVWKFLDEHRDDGALRAKVCSSSWALTDMNEQFNNQMLQH